MPDTPRNGPAPESSQPGPSAAPTAAPTWPPPPLTDTPKTNRWLPFATLAIALVGLGVGLGAWLRPMPSTSSAPVSEPSFSDEEVAAAKANVCEAFGLVKQNVVLNTHRTNPVPDDAIGALATEVYGDLALYQGGDYLIEALAAEPATPIQLAHATESLGNTMKKYGMVVLAGEPESARDPLKQAAEADTAALDGMCK